MTKQEILDSIKQREMDCWRMVRTFTENADAHGVMDMGAELQALQRSRMDVEKL